MERVWRRLQFYYEKILARFATEDVKVWMLHEVKPTLQMAKNKSFCILQEEFIGFLDNIQKQDYTVVPIDEIYRSEYRRRGVITFDDGFEEIYSFVYPILKQREMPFAVFVTLDFLDKPGYLSKDQVKVLAEEPLCIIGAHSISHAKLRHCCDSYNEIYGCKIELEKITKQTVHYFAYPYGTLTACSCKNMKEVKRARYKKAFSTIKGNVPVYRGKNIYFIPRINVNQRYLELIGKEAEEWKELHP